MKAAFNKQLLFKILAVFFIFSLIEIILGSFVIYQTYKKQASENLEEIAQRVSNDIVYKNGQWDMSKYNADPNIPETYPLYVFSSDGFVLDRWRPLKGTLDTSDFRRLLTYSKPQTINTPTNQVWRVFSKPLVYKNSTLGVISVGYFNPDIANISAVDSRLFDAVNKINSKIKFGASGVIDTSNLDPRDVKYDITFQVVDAFNNILVKNNNNNSIDRLPNYIDPSYVGKILQSPSRMVVTDEQTHNQFLLFSSPIFDNANNVVGVVVAGTNISTIYQLVTNFIIVSLILNIGLSILAAIILLKALITKQVNNSLISGSHSLAEVNSIIFNKEKSVINIDNNSISIPYGTNQYYLCLSLFNHPKRQFEVDELLEKFGEENFTNWRKVYDAMLIINKKVGNFMDEKLIILRDKKYLINPNLLPKILK